MAADDLITGPPDFIGVGTQRSGTTWWFASLLEHPDIAAPRDGIKELHFFNRFGVRPLKKADVERYYARFPRRPGQLAGEWTPRYMHDPCTPRMIRRVAPEAKLLILFRDPVERFRSGVPKELERERAPSVEDAVADAIERGRYASQLRHLRAEHPDAEVLILQYEQCAKDPLTHYRRTLEFIGADTGAEPPDFARPRGKSREKQKRPMWADLEAALVSSLEDEVRELAAMEPQIDLSLWRNFAHLAQGSHAAA